MNCRKKIHLRYAFWLLLIFAMTTVLKSIFEVATNPSHKIRLDDAFSIFHRNLQQEDEKRDILFPNTPSHPSLQSTKQHAMVVSSHLNDSVSEKSKQQPFLDANVMEKLSKHYIPLVYRKDPAALHKYIAYITKTEEPLPLQTNAIIIVSNYRSGSSFFGEFFNQHPDIFYVFEPLLPLSPTDRCDVNVQFKTKVVYDVAQCIFPDWNKIYFGIDKATRPGKSRNVFTCLRKHVCFYPFTKELAGEEHCPRASLTKAFDAWEHCGSININLASNTCRRKKMVALKLIRLCDLYELEELVTKLHMNIKVVHLIRDPRGIANSRRILHRRLHLRNSLTRTCSKQANNANIGLFIKPKWLEGKYKMFRYEDAAVDPFQTAKDLYNFIGVDYPDVVEEWLVNNTAISQSLDADDMATYNVSRSLSKEEYIKMKMRKRRVNPWGHTRNSKAVVQQWQRSLSYLQALSIEDGCKEIMKIAGYLPLNNSIEYANKTKYYFTDKFLN